MKHIKFEKRSGTERKQRIISVAYAAQQVGGWEGSNVTKDIMEHLLRDGYPADSETPKAGQANRRDKKVDLFSRIAEAQDWLQQQGYAAREVRGRRTVMFVMDPDVEVPLPDYVKGRQFRKGKAESTPDVSKVVYPHRPSPPLPSASKDPNFGPLFVLLKRWWQNDPEAADAWVASVVADLEQS